MTCPELERFLYPYLDGEFEPAEHAEFEQHLKECEPCAQRVHSERAAHEAIRARCRALASTAAPEALRARLQQALRDEPRQGQSGAWMRYAAAAAAVVAVAGTSLYFTQRPVSRHRFVQEAAARHAKGLPLEIQRPSARQVEAWFIGKLDHRVAVPTFANAELAGARLSNVQDKPAAYIRYGAAAEEGQAGRIGLLVYQDKTGEADFRPDPELDTSLGYNVVSWREGELVYQLVSDLDEADIRQLLVAGQRNRQVQLPSGAPLNQLPSLPVQPASFRR